MDPATLGVILGPIVGYLLNHYLGERKWQKAREIAGTLINSDPTIGPDDAIQKALMAVHLDRLAKETAKVRDAFIPKGTIPKLDLNVEIDSDKPKAP